MSSGCLLGPCLLQGTVFFAAFSEHTLVLQGFSFCAGKKVVASESLLERKINRRVSAAVGTLEIRMQVGERGLCFGFFGE